MYFADLHTYIYSVYVIHRVHCDLALNNVIIFLTLGCRVNCLDGVVGCSNVEQLLPLILGGCLHALPVACVVSRDLGRWRR